MRSLADHGIRSYCATEQLHYVARSRFYQPPAGGRPFLSDPFRLKEYLADYPTTEAVLFPCADSWTRAISSLEGTVDRRLSFCLPPIELLDKFVNKEAFESLLDQHNIPRPRTISIESETDIDRVESDPFGDWFLKPVDSQSFFQRYQVKAFRVGSKEKAKEKWRQISGDGHRTVMQEYVPGPASCHYFIDGYISRDHKLKALFPRQRIRMYPVDFGDSSYMTSVPRGQIEPAEQSITRLLTAVKYRGIFSGEFKFDHRDGQYKLLEINTRPWAYIGFASSCGVNVAYLAYLDALGKEVPEITTHKAGRSLCFMPNDFWAYRSLAAQRKLGLASWLGSWISAHSTVFSFSDPLPSVVCWSDILLGKARRLMSRG
jgi:predicted ATP-grasp superfamily ATP-dependent carboligase